MEESSEKRRQRLQAMRVEASSSSQTSPSPNPPPSPHSLTNPLLHPPPPFAGDEISHPLPRFDYYTDPMAAFSSSKRRPTGVGPPYTSPPVNFRSPIPLPSPMSYSSPRPSPPVQSPYSHPNPNFAPTPNPNFIPVPSFTPGGSPSSNYGRGSSFPHSNYGRGDSFPHSNHVRSGGSSHFNPNFTPLGGSPSSNYGRGSSSPYPNYGRGGGSPHPNYGSGGGGRDWRYGVNSSGGRSGGGRGRGYGEGQFYVKAMVKDPWRKLKPTVGNILFPKGQDSWLPRSIVEAGAKRAKLARSSDMPRTGSLAECLALAMEDAVNEGHDVEV